MTELVQRISFKELLAAGATMLVLWVLGILWFAL